MKCYPQKYHIMTALPVFPRSLLFALVLTSFSLAGCSTSPPPTNPFEVDQEEWTPLFNGQSLEGWTPKITGYAIGIYKGKTFHVEDGILTVRYDEYTQPPTDSKSVGWLAG